MKIKFSIPNTYILLFISCRSCTIHTEDQPVKKSTIYKIYTVLGKEAQDAVGIPPEKQVPIKKMSVLDPQFNIATAYAARDGIYVNQHRLHNEPYGSKRCTMFHEAIHIKYGDATCTGAACSSSKDQERRADLESLYATQCFKCVQEEKACQLSQDDDEDGYLEKKGYLYAEEIEKIAQDLYREHKLCTVHTSNYLYHILHMLRSIFISKKNT
ncbi:MAG: hypothetical protein WC707_02055 [Candidatus Babeliaceae bacterium]|jgi:hypothetical protein